jgi:hypothetical protein
MQDRTSAGSTKALATHGRIIRRVKDRPAASYSATAASPRLSDSDEAGKVESDVMRLLQFGHSCLRPFHPAVPYWFDRGSVSIPPIDSEMQISRTRLSDKTSRLHPRRVVHSRYGPHTLALLPVRDTLSEGFSYFVISIAAPRCFQLERSPGGGSHPRESAALSGRRPDSDSCSAANTGRQCLHSLQTAPTIGLDAFRGRK